MKIKLLLFSFLALVTIILGCKESVKPKEAVIEEGPIMKMPITTASPQAKKTFLTGMEALDMGRPIDAHETFVQATQRDPNFVMGHLMSALTADSFEEFLTSFKRAETISARASESENILVQIVRANLDNNVDKALELSQQLVNVNPESPRALLWLAGGLEGVNKNVEAREVLDQAIAMAPDFVPAYFQAGNNYMFNEPKDLKKAEEMFLKAAELAPEEANSYDLLGDVYRSQGDLEKARDAYTKAAEYSGADGSPYQQRGHVNSFLGDYDAARADYDKSIEMGRSNQKAAFAVYKAYVNIHAGKPSQAIKELEAIAAETSNTSSMLFALSSAYWIALHHNMHNKAQSIHNLWKTIRMQQAELGGTEELLRNGKADVVYREGLLACSKRQYNTANAKAEEFAKLVEPDADPRKMERYHQLKGTIALEQKSYNKAIEEFQKGDIQNNMYVKYLLGKSYEGAKKMEEAVALYNEVATHNFNGVGEALARQEVLPKVR